MINREKVIKGLECCTFILGKRKCNECPYRKDLPDNGCYELQDDFHALMKEQEGYVSVPFSWLVKFCSHIDFKEPLADEEREKEWKKKLEQQFGLRVGAHIEEQQREIPDRDNVIKGLKDIIDFFEVMSVIENRCNELKQEAEDAIILMKEQEPRVMTLEEVKRMKYSTICAVEQRSKIIKNIFNAEYDGIVTLGDKNFFDFGLYGDTSRYRRTEGGYGKTWRCWTSRPTNEQREAVKWE